MSVKVLYFATVKDVMERGQELLTLPETVKTVADLVNWLSIRDDRFKKAVTSMPRVRASVNMEMAKAQTLVKDGDEVAFFPPVTGG